MIRPKERFGILDGMILMAAIAIGLGWARFLESRPGYLFDPFEATFIPAFPGQTRVSPHWFVLATEAWTYYALAAPVMATSAIGLLVVGLRRPGPSRRRRFRRSGTSGCAAVTVVSLLGVVRFGVEVGRWWHNEVVKAAQGLQSYSDWWTSAYDIIRPTEPGIAVVACWSILLLTRRFRIEPTLIDRLGRAIAVYWVLAMVFYWIAGMS